jgi:DNA-binding response OmpR family regulator
MTKPFHKDELVARIHAIVRRSKGHAQSVIRPAKLTSTSTPRRSKSTASACT